jgi:hypothetical protein
MAAHTEELIQAEGADGPQTEADRKHSLDIGNPGRERLVGETLTGAPAGCEAHANLLIQAAISKTQTGLLPDCES